MPLLSSATKASPAAVPVPDTAVSTRAFQHMAEATAVRAGLAGQLAHLADQFVGVGASPLVQAECAAQLVEGVGQL